MNYRTSIGLDVHARSIKAAAFIPETGEIIEKSFAYDPAALIEWANGFPKPVHAVYESGPTGFDLARTLEKASIECIVGAVSKMLRPSGDRVKTDKRDAKFLARMLAVGNIVAVHIPSLEFEAARDLARAREDARQDLMRARHLLSKFLLRKGIVYKGKSTWTKMHKTWLSTLEFEYPDEKFVFNQYLDGILVFEQRRDRLDAAIEKRSKAPEFSSLISALKCLRGIGVITAFSIVVEIGDFSRFPNARSFMSYLGLVPSEDSSGETISRGKITRTGNIHVRTLLVEAAWHNARKYNPLSTTAFSETYKVPCEIATVANMANRRLYERYLHLKARHKRPATANIAIARELAGFVWAIATSIR